MQRPDPQKITEALAARFSSPTRSTRLTVVLGRWLAVSFTICFVTGLFSHGLQNPPSWMFFPTSPVWIYQLSQGLHVTSGIASIPLLLAKLWSVYPELLRWPLVKSIPHALERASIALFIASSLLQLTTGLINTYKWYPWPFPFRETHYWLAWVIWGSLLLHIAVKLPAIMTNWNGRAVRLTELQDAGSGSPAAGTEASSIAGVTGAAPGRWSRRAFLAGVGVTTGAVVLTTAGQSFSWLSPLNLFAPRVMGTGPQSVPVNRTATEAKVADLATSAHWSLEVTYQGSSTTFSLAELRALPQHEQELPIACVEGWSQMARWRGVRIRDLLSAVGAPHASVLRVTSLEPQGPYRLMSMPAEYVQDERTLVALELNGAVLDVEHGYPARIIAPGRPGVLQTKWLHTVEVL
ncbi:molybdopterin-dependent oxidoreductase [Arthrobacter sp. ISL-28]|uniref:molybdopterin-dependent oxidoreductase n=1 Tax=Arthrobacter sp. ISL-28 TaxID=2819108 RepID=UPI001BE89BFF|nr:molybdopterin-dependent oxidoreductase [Arthrobacter sp. ISL-28]MBT2519878.1 molybdopterin-dependent oxidoreductase [Arthrobacter sp. ISL-28]